jgi:hypothetical protein
VRHPICWGALIWAAVMTGLMFGILFGAGCDADYLPVPPADVDCPDVAPGELIGVVSYVTCPDATDVDGLDVVRSCRPYPPDEPPDETWSDCRLVGSSLTPDVHCRSVCP